MADRILKPDSGNDLVLQNDDGSGKIEINENASIPVTGTLDVSGATLTTSSAQKQAIVQAGPGSGSLDVSSGTFTTSTAQKQAIVDGATIATVPSNVVAHTSAGSAPSGWSEYTSARGRMIVGLPSGGTNAGTVGTAFTNVQDKTKAGSHSHGTPDHAHGTGLRTISELAYNHTWVHGTSGSITTNSHAGQTAYTSTGAEGLTTLTNGGNTDPGGVDIDTSDLLAYIQLMAIKKD